MRPATYESESEAEFFAQIFRGHESALRNTTFALLAPDGETTLCRTGRGPSFAYEDAEDFAAGLEELSGKFKPTDKQRSLPTARDLRLALNIAASDQQVLVVGVLRPEEKSATVPALTEAAWSDQLAGRAHYALLADTTALQELPGFDAKADVLVVRPDAWGAAVEVVAALSAEDDLVAGILPHAPVRDTKKSRDHIRVGERAGRQWKSALNVTDPGSEATPRGRRPQRN